MNWIKTVHLLAFVFTTTATAHERHLAEEASHRCGTRTPDKNDFLAGEQAREFREFIQERNPEFLNPVIEVPVCFHVPRKRFFGGSGVSNAQLQAELDHLNEAYSASSCCDPSLSECSGRCSSNTGISFVMAKLDANGNVDGVADSVSAPNACVTRPRQRSWTSVRFQSRDAKSMKSALYKGDERTLNLYYTNLGGGLLGYATFPWEYDANREQDGVVISPIGIRGSSGPYNEGDTVAHEVGHWLGLFHTFEGGCSPGDGIADTAAEGEAYFGCNPSEQRNTCSGDAEPDPIFNFMDYSDDKCLFEFTAGQITKMVDSYLTFRSPALRSARMLRSIQEGLYETGSLEADATQVFEMNNIPMGSVVTCHVEITKGDEKGNLDLFMNSHGRFSDFECMSESDENHESCSLEVTSDKLYVFVHAASSASEFTVVCDVHHDGLIG